MFADIDVGSTVADREFGGCIVTLGAGPDGANGFCIADGGRLLFPDSFVQDCDACTEDPEVDGPAASNTGIAEVVIRRFIDDKGTPELEDDVIQFTLAVSYGDQTYTFNSPESEIQCQFAIEGRVYTIGSGLEFNSAPTGEENELVAVIAVEGSIEQEGGGYEAEPTTEVTRILTAGRAAIAFTSDCVYETWTTGNSPVVPGSGAGNLQWTWTRTNFGPAVVGAETTSVKFEAEARDDPTKPWLAANVTAIAVTGGTFANSAEFLANNGSRTDGVQLEALELLASNAITFTTTLFNCTATDLPWNAADPDNELDVNVEGYDEQSSPLIDVEVATLPAQLWVQREARLRLVYTDKRDYDTFDMPIPVGCDVPFEYSFDVFNEVTFYLFIYLLLLLN